MSCFAASNPRRVYHRKEERVDGHLFITVLAYQFVQIVRKQLQEAGIQGRWSTLREILGVPPHHCRAAILVQQHTVHPWT